MTLYFAKKSGFPLIWQGAIIAVTTGGTSLLAYFAYKHTGFLPYFTYKIFLFLPAIAAAYGYWNISDDGVFSVPLYFLQIGLIWALYYLLTVDPPYTWFVIAYNRFADLAYFFIIGFAIYRIRYGARSVSSSSMSQRLQGLNQT